MIDESKVDIDFRQTCGSCVLSSYGIVANYFTGCPMYRLFEDYCLHFSLPFQNWREAEQRYAVHFDNEWRKQHCRGYQIIIDLHEHSSQRSFAECHKLFGARFILDSGVEANDLERVLLDRETFVTLTYELGSDYHSVTIFHNGSGLRARDTNTNVFADVRSLSALGTLRDSVLWGCPDLKGVVFGAGSVRRQHEELEWKKVDLQYSIDKPLKSEVYRRPYPIDEPPKSCVFRAGLGELVLLNRRTGKANVLALRFADADRHVTEMPKYLVGRDHDADICIPDSGISSRHCQIFSDFEGRIYVYDLNSANGTHIIREGQKIRVRGKEEILNGDILILGDETRGGVEFSIMMSKSDVDAPKLDADAGVVERAAPDMSGHSRGRGCPEVPGGVVDRVHFSVTASPVVLPGSEFGVDVWSHLEVQRLEVIKRALKAVEGGKLIVKSKGPVRVARGTILSVRLRMDGFVVEEAEDTILWDGEIGNADFSVKVPEDMPEGPRSGLATIRAEGLQIARVYFHVRVGKDASTVCDLSEREERHRKAFVSYASSDRNEVLARVQGMLKAAPGLDVFMDVLSLRSGQDWAHELWSVIPKSDVFYLFWSANAKQSEWVDKEWRCALQTRGEDFIDPVPLVSPQEVPPPPELSKKHFNDWVLAYMVSSKYHS